MAARKGHKAVARLLPEKEHKAAVCLLLENWFDIAAQNFDKSKTLDRRR